MPNRKHYSIDLKQNLKKNNINLNELTRYQLIEEQQKDVAAWFRGTSHFHIEGADNLLNALRDDGEQNTTHRVRTCLNMIGLKPMIKAKQIKFLILLSRCNDLVFLWFLMEMHYKTPKRNPNAYSLNEQLICSAICHLDMVTTLRELDKILPCSRKPSIGMKKTRCKRQHVKEFEMPYFKKYYRPVHYGKQLFVEKADFKMNLKFHGLNKIHNHIENESDRWYAYYQFNISKRVAHSIIRFTITNIFDNFVVVSSKLRTSDILCTYHKTAKMMSTKQKKDFKAFANDERSKIINHSLDKDIQEKLCKFGEQTNLAQKRHSLKIISSDYKLFNKLLGRNVLNNHHTNSINDGIKRNLLVQMKSLQKEPDSCASYDNTLKDGTAINVKYMYSCQCSENKRCLKLKNLKNSKSKADKTDYCEIHRAKECNKLFNSVVNHKPFKFTYKRIFAPKCEDNREICIRKMCLQALDADISSCSTIFDQSHLVYDEAVNKCIETTFDRDEKKCEADTLINSKARNGDILKPLGLYSALPDFNAENDYVMEQMLSEAFQYLRKNPKFVWAQLPDAHRVPFLREWVAHRFGKEYTAKERLQSYQRSCLCFRTADKSNYYLPIPKANQIGENLFLNYNRRNHIEKKLQHIKSKYYHRLGTSLMADTRILWLAMRCYICSNGPQRNSFFAYMPSRLKDIHHFRLWKSSEYRT